jgi:hypothetical protein
LGAFYIPPSSNAEKFVKISEKVNQVSQQILENDEVIVFGDFNRPKLEFLPDEDNPNIFLIHHCQT